MMQYTTNDLVLLLNDIKINGGIFAAETIEMWRWQYQKFFKDYQITGFKLYKTEDADSFAEELFKMYPDTDKITMYKGQFKIGAKTLYNALIDTIARIESDDIKRPKMLYVPNEQLNPHREFSMKLEQQKKDKENEDSVKKEEAAILLFEQPKKRSGIPDQVVPSPCKQHPLPTELANIDQAGIEIWFEYGSKFKNIPFKNVMKRFFEWRKKTGKIDGTELVQEDNMDILQLANDKYSASTYKFYEEFDSKRKDHAEYPDWGFFDAATQTREAFNDYYKPSDAPAKVTFHTSIFFGHAQKTLKPHSIKYYFPYNTRKKQKRVYYRRMFVVISNRDKDIV